MATFNNGESGASVRTKINEAIDKVDGNAAFDNDIDVNGNVEVTGNLATSGNATLGTADTLTGGAADGLNVVGASNGLLAKFGGDRTVYDRALQINEFAIGGTNNVGFEFNAPGSGSTAEIAFATGGTQRMVIDGSGFVTFNDDPTIQASNAALNITPASDAQTCRINFTNAAGTFLTRILAGGANGTDIEFDGDLTFSAGHGVDINSGNIDGTIIGASSAAAGDFTDLSASGFLGVGTTTPAVEFEIVGSTPQFQMKPTGDTQSCRIQFANAAGTVVSQIWGGGVLGNDIQFKPNNVERLRVSTTGAEVTGDLDVSGSLSKGSGSFRIPHPIREGHDLVHSFVEGPQADNIYRGRVALVDGTATVNLDEAGRMTEGTFVALNGNIQCFTSNEDGWTAVRGSVSGNTLTIEAQDATCTDTVSWLVIGERHDSHMLNTDWTDAAGRVITEPEKQTAEEE